MAEPITRRSKVVACGAIHPEYLEVINTYVQHAGIELVHADADGATGQAPANVAELLDDQTALWSFSRQTFRVH